MVVNNNRIIASMHKAAQTQRAVLKPCKKAVWVIGINLAARAAEKWWCILLIEFVPLATCIRNSYWFFRNVRLWDVRAVFKEDTLVLAIINEVVAMPIAPAIIALV